jgi:hypothetical protein
MKPRWWVPAVALALLLPAQAGPLEAPMPPGDLDGEWETATNGAGDVFLSWTAPTDTGSSDLAGYKVYRFEDGVPLGPAQTTATSYTHSGLDPESVYLYYVTAVNTDGEESIPSNPVLLGEYPPCAVFTWGLDPPHATPRPHCLIP